jgi:minor extracellular serine protease Vpr
MTSFLKLEPVCGPIIGIESDAVRAGDAGANYYNSGGQMQFKSLKVLFAAAAITGMAGPLPVAYSDTTDGNLVAGQMEALPNTWFVQLTGAPTADGNSLTSVRAEKKAFRTAAASAKIKFTERYAFDTLFNGLSVTASRTEINRIKSLSGVAAVWPVAIIEAPPTGAGASPDLFTAITMTGADVAQNELGYDGTGVKVAVMDTGIDIDHPAFGGSGTNGTTSFPSARVAYGYDFVGDAFNADPSTLAYSPTTVPDPNPDDCGGHGTHVAGIVGANVAGAGGLKGVAPGVTFGAYRVFGCAGSTTAEVMIAAMERALADGMQVLNMSIGSAFQWPQYPTAEAADRLVNKGMVVVASIGNSGDSGLYSAGSPGLGNKVIGVASYDNIAVMLSEFTISPDDTAIGYSAMTGSVAVPTSGSLPMARTGTSTTTNDACSALPANSLTGKAALIRRGTCTFATKAVNAQNAGASAVVIYNNSAGRFAGTIANSGVTIPTVQISGTEGVLINNRLAAGAVTMTWQSSVGSYPNATGNLISSFSSYGLSPDLALKPDIGAPGGLIYSTYPLELGGYATLSGTSMASPHVAGTAALMLQARPKTNSQVMRTLLQNTAEPKNWWGNPGLGFLDNVHRQGAGMVQIDAAILATTKVEPGKIAAGEGQSGPYAQVLRIENNGTDPVTYDLSFVNALSTGGVITPSFTTSNASVAFSAPSVAVPAGGATSVTATITPATGPVNGQYGGYILLTPQGGGQAYRVPYAGFVGDYQGISVLGNTVGFPFLARIATCAVGFIGYDCRGVASYSIPGGTPVYTMQLVAGLPDVPYFLVHFEHHARLFRVELFDQNGKAWHRAYNDDYVGRNSTSTSFFAYSFGGTTVSGNKAYTLPDGTYYAKVSVLKALGDSANPAHWEYWTSPMFVIDRP